jgi:hypothetical protein
MSTLAYAEFTTKREEAAPGSSSSQNPPGVSTYVDALSALVPAEVLTLHALILSATTKVDNATTVISEPQTLRWAFVGLVVMSIVLYVAPRFSKWDRLDYLRAAIPPLAFLAWTMLQRSTAFDAVAPALKDAPRTVTGLFLGVVLGLVAAALANKADQKT